MKQPGFLFSLLFFFLCPAWSQSPVTGPRKGPVKSVQLKPVPLHATPLQIQALLKQERYLYFGPGTYNIGTLELNNWKEGLLWGAGRLTTNLQGAIRINGKSTLTLGNFSVTNTTLKDHAIVEIASNKDCDITLMNTLVSGNKEVTAVGILAPGRFLVQGCNLKWNDIGLRIDHPKAITHVLGGNMQYNRIHIEQRNGHLDARAFGMQGNKGDADIVVHTPSLLGYHLVEGVRSEGNNGLPAKEMLLHVPPTPEAVNVALRANTLGSMTQYADYGGSGTLLLLQNVNYGGAEDKRSVGVVVSGRGAARVLSLGNKYGLSYDAAPGPFVITANARVQSMGDLWMLPNTTDYSKRFNEPITPNALRAAGKVVPQNLSFLTTADSSAVTIPDFPVYRSAVMPRIANLAELMLNVTQFGAVPDDGRDDREAIIQAMNAAEKDGVSAPLFFPAGRYELHEPLFLDHLAGGGFWGEGEQRSLLVSTSGKGVITSDGAGYAAFVDLAFVNKAGAETKTTDFDWVNNLSADKKRGATGAALQANMFYRCRFENGSAGMAVGRNRMGDGFMLIDCIFRNQRTANGGGSSYLSENFNALTNPLVHCLFENVDCAVLNAKGSFNFYGNRLASIHSAALRWMAVVSDGFALVNNEMDASPVPFIATGHSSAKAHLLVEHARVQAPAKTAAASVYNLGGSVFFLRSSFPNRTITNGGGIGDNSLLLYKTSAAGATATGRAHRYPVNAITGSH